MAVKKDPLSDINYLLEKASMVIKNTNKEKKKKATCKTCGGSPLVYKGLCQSCIDIERNAKQATEVGKRWFSTNGYEYIYTQDGDKLKPVLYSRYRMAELIGRPLQEWEQVGHKDGKKQNNADDNLILTTRAGFDLSSLICPHCDQPYIPLSALTASSYESNSATTVPDDPVSES